MKIKDIELLRQFIFEEIGRNYHSIDTDSHTWDMFADYNIEYYPLGNGMYTVDVGYKGEKLVPQARFKDESECKSYARQVVDKHRITIMNNPK